MPRSYQKLFKQKTVITNFDGKALPFRLYLDDVMTFALSFIFFMLIDFFSPYRVLNLLVNRWIVIILSTALFTWAARKIDPAGKPLVKYLADTIAYLFRSHLTNGFDRVSRVLAHKNGRIKRIKPIKGKCAWEPENVLLPLKVISSEHFDFESKVYLNVSLKHDVTKFSKSKKLGINGKYHIRGLAPGHYRIKDRHIEKLNV